MPQPLSRMSQSWDAAVPRPRMSITREDVLTVADVAALLDLKPYTVKEYARRGILPGRKLGRNWRFLRPELEDVIKQLPHAQGR